VGDIEYVNFFTLPAQYVGELNFFLQLFLQGSDNQSYMNLKEECLL